MDLVTKNRVSCCIRSGAVRRCEGLHGSRSISHELTMNMRSKSLTSAGMSSSKCLVSSGFRSSGRYGAVYLWMFSQSIPRNHGWACAEERGVSDNAAEVPMTRP